MSSLPGLLSRVSLCKDILTEAALRLNHHRILTSHLGLFPSLLAKRFQQNRILDLACGPRGWTLDVARTYPAVQVVGVDHCEPMIVHARELAVVGEIPNLQFQVMDIRQPLTLPDGSFDLVNGRMLSRVLVPSEWHTVLAECQRLLRPGGVLHVTEAEWDISNSAAFERYSDLCLRAFQRAGYAFSPQGRTLGITAVLRSFFQQGSYCRIHSRPAIIDSSARMPAHDAVMQELFVVFRLIQPFLVQMDVVGQQEIEALYQQVFLDMQREDFCCISYLLTVWGETPRTGGHR